MAPSGATWYGTRMRTKILAALAAVAILVTGVQLVATATTTSGTINITTSSGAGTLVFVPISGGSSGSTGQYIPVRNVMSVSANYTASPASGSTKCRVYVTYLYRNPTNGVKYEQYSNWGEDSVDMNACETYAKTFFPFLRFP